MIDVGLKLGPELARIPELDEVKPAFVELWFDISKYTEYDAVFHALEQRNIPSGIHFWGTTQAGMFTNVCYPDEDLINESLRLIERTIDIAARHNCVYVNIHPGNSAIVAIDFEKQEFRVCSEPVPVQQSISLFLQHTEAICRYATSKNILLTVETIPMLDTTGWSGEEPRKRPLDVYNLPIEAVLRYAESGHAVANDFSHTAATIISDDSENVRRHVFNITRRVFRQTRLIHAGFIVPPYNGTDFHGSFDHPKFTSQLAVPNHDDIIQLLRLFNSREDTIYLLAEPAYDHVGNFRRLRALLEASKK